MQRQRHRKSNAAADKEVKASVKKDKNNFVEDLASQAEEAAGQGNLKRPVHANQKIQWKVPAVKRAD